MQDERDRFRDKLAGGAAGLTMLLVLLLAGCGDLSLLKALEGDSPGELRFSPNTVLIPENTDFTFAVLGGFTPYVISLSAGVTPKDGNTWVFPGRDIGAESEVFTVEATDLLGHKATAEVTVYAVASPLELNVSEITLLVGQSWTFTASGGAGGYAWAVDDVVVDLDPPPSPDDRFPYLAAIPGGHTVTVTDSLGVSRGAAVTVKAVVADAPLQVSPTLATVAVDEVLSFIAEGGTGPYHFEVLAGGAGGDFSVADANPATYLAPAAAGTDTIRLTDDLGATVGATVNVIAASSLKLSPESPTVSAIGDTIQFEASGGTGPGTYTFSSGKPDQGRIDAATGYYVQLGVKNVVVTVQDASGAAANTIVKFK
jgi:hypothetical protein